MKMDSPLVKIGIVLIVIASLYFLMIKPILEKVGVIKTTADVTREEQAEKFTDSTESPFSPNYYKVILNAHLLTRAASTDIANQLNDAIGRFTDDELSVYSALKKMTYKTQLSFVSEIFNKLFDSDLYIMLKRNLSDEELETVHGIVNSYK